MKYMKDDITVDAFENLSAFEKAKNLYEMGRTSWAVDMIEQDLLSDRYHSLSDDEKDSVHAFLYEEGISKSSTEEELYDNIESLLGKKMERV